MSIHRALGIAFLALFVLPGGAGSEPPAHAPAHGYRAKQKQKHVHASEHQIVFDSERGIRVVVGLPGVFYHEGHFYRHADGGWQVSLRADTGWGSIAVANVPRLVFSAHTHPGPAKVKFRHRK